MNGPIDSDLIVQLPAQARLRPGMLRPTLCRIPERLFRRIERAVADKSNWVPISAHVFRHEKSISDYLGTYPHHLEDGFQPYPSLQVREAVFPDRTRSDVLLIDRGENPVVIECKQGNPTLAHIDQLRSYLRKAARITGKKARGILLHSGASRLPADVRRHSLKHPAIEVIQYRINFNPSI